MVLYGILKTSKNGKL